MLALENRRNHRRNHRREQRRAGAVAVEFAIALPVLLLFTFTGVEFSRVNMMRNTAVNAAYEGARQGILPGATAAECETSANQLLSLVQVAGGTVVATPILPNSTSVSVTVSIPITAANGFVTPQFYVGSSIVATVSLPRELAL